MSGRKKTNGKEIDVSGSLMSAITMGSLTSVKKLVNSHSLSHCEEWSGGFVPLCNAIKSGRIEIAKFLLQEGAKVNTETDKINTPLHLATELGHDGLELIRLLLDKSAAVEALNDRNETPLHLATRKGLVEVCKVLLKNGANINALNAEGNAPLHLIISHKQNDVALVGKQEKIDDVTRDEIIKLLLTSGADVTTKAANGYTAFHSAVENGRRETVQIFLEFGVDVNLRTANDMTALHVAAQGGHLNIVKTLCLNKANVEACCKEGSRPLHCVFGIRQTEIVDVLCRYGADVNARKNNGWTPLHFAALRGNEKTVEYLCKKKADVEAREENNYWTPLHAAACNRWEDAMMTLLSYGADINARGLDGVTPLHWVAIGDNYQHTAAEVLLENGADINAVKKDPLGGTPLESAISKNEEQFRLQHPVDSDEYSDDDDCFDNCFIPDRCEMIQTLKKHLMKLKVAGLYVSKKNAYLLSQSFSYISDFKEECKEEIRRLKTWKSKRGFTLYDVLVNSKNISHANKLPLKRYFKSPHLRRFPIYGSLILSNFLESVLRFDLIDPGQKALDVLVKASSKPFGKNHLVLPVELSNHILSYLDNSDLKTLIYFVKALKN